MDDWRPFLASGEFYVLWKRMYAISLYRYDVCIYSGSRGQNEIWRHRDFWHCIFHHSFCFLGANYCNRFHDCSSFGESFLLMGGVSSFLFKSRWFRSWSWELLLTRRCSYCLVKNKGGCSFGLFNNDSYVLFRAIGVIWDIWELTAELVCLLFWTLCLVPYPLGLIIKTMKAM